MDNRLYVAIQNIIAASQHLSESAEAFNLLSMDDDAQHATDLAEELADVGQQYIELMNAAVDAKRRAAQFN